MEDLIKDTKKKSLSNEDILRMCDNKVNIFTYPELLKFNSIDQVLYPHNAAIILYMTRENFGHWVAVIRTADNIIEHFDSYGLKPDKELKFISNYFRRESGQLQPHLTYLYYKCPYQVSYNQYKLQKLKKDVNTCGRFAALRVLLKELPLDNFYKLFQGDKYLDSDDRVALITSFI